jgi:hypothetical protein
VAAAEGQGGEVVGGEVGKDTEGTQGERVEASGGEPAEAQAAPGEGGWAYFLTNPVPEYNEIRNTICA